ncbi:GDP-mannose 4,6-dehydratase [Castellaniella sp.]|uniref:GDP-mannose 4,6-dehydratase n=1 Tax=Castellaniella sp. TaxID=1955812 RepID=UPI003A91AB23
MNILLTGAHGFTGRYFLEAALDHGHAVTALQADLTNPDALGREVAGVQPDAVVHLAAISFVAHADQSALYAVNVVGTTNLLAALAALPKSPSKVLLASSANVYGNCTVSPIAETQAVAPVNHYATSKLAMEQMARTYMDRLPIVITRPFNYTGPGQAPQFVIPKLVSHYARRESSVELGNMDVEREFNDVRMVCEAYLALLDHGVPGEIYNVCSGQPHTLQEVITALTELSGHHLETRVNPAFVRANEVRRLCGDGAKLKRLCDASGVTLKQPDLREMLQWMLAEAAA